MKFMSNLTMYLIVLTLGSSSGLLAQNFSRADSIRGSITKEREWWDLNYYHLDIDVDTEMKSIGGTNTIRYRVLKSHNRLQVDLQAPLKITRITQDGKTLSFTSEGPAHFVQLEKPQVPGSIESIVVHYEGIPHVAKRAPWDGGVSWSTDSQGKPFVATSCQGIGASIWWPCKDHMYDEPDSMLMTVSVPKGLMDVSNGRLVSRIDGETYDTFVWRVSNPINNYGVNINIADYVHFGETYNGLNGQLDLDYYVLKENEQKARQQFKEVPAMLDAFEYWFGPYPFYEDGFKLVEVPYLGMEHQSSITYGNGYVNGYRGMDLSGTGWGMKFDFIIIHESGHEWFANNITYKDRADMWIHEGFTAYSECLYVEYHHGKEAGAEYVIGTRSNIQNDKPIIAPYGVNAAGSGDMYYKGSNMLHTLRQWVGNDTLWRQLLIDMNRDFYHRTVTSEEIENYISGKLGLKLEAFFDQYLRDSRLPILEYRIYDKRLAYRWTHTVPGFTMPITAYIDGKRTVLNPGAIWRSVNLDHNPEDVRVDKNYYVATLNVTGK